MPLTLNDIEYTEPVGSNTGSFSEKATELSRTFHVAWAERMTFVQAMLGAVTVTGGMFFQIRAQPYEPSSYFEAQSAEFKGLGEPGIDANGVISYEKAEVKVKYGPRPEEEEKDKEEDDKEALWQEHSLTFRSDYIKNPPFSLHWKNDAEPVEKWSEIHVVVGDIVYKRFRVASFKPRHYVDHIGKLNKTKWKGWPAKTLMIAGMDAKKQIDAARMVTKRELTLTLKYRNKPWDQMFRGGKGWEEIVKSDDAEAELYDLVDFRDL